MQNLEQKFRCTDLPSAAAAARALGAIDSGLLHQHDLFFPAPHARLKLRLFPDQPARAELISYRRPDSATARTSDYHITTIDNPAALVTTLTHALGTPRHLVKTRHLFLYKSTRIHLDTVTSLGTFVELETVLTVQPLESAQAELAQVIAALGLQNPIPTAYLDLLPTS